MQEEVFDFKKPRVAYFSMEIGIFSKMPSYSGGLGVLAGDIIRSASDLDVPMIGVSLLYKKGYFKQRFDSEGNQLEGDESFNPYNFLKRLPNKISVRIRGRDVYVCCWLLEVVGLKGNKVPVIFLDSDLDENCEEDRYITQKLYGGDLEYRLCQEIILGIGGVRMLESLGCDIEKFHMNEGHSALLGLELYKKLSSIALVREKCVFTTHTPVPSGHDQFEKGMVEALLGDYISEDIQKDLFYNNKLNMTYLGLRFSEHINGVAQKHKEVSKSMFPGYNIESVTNGVHSYFWTSDSFKKLYDKCVPYWREDPLNLRYVMGVSNEKIWVAHMKAKEKLINFVNKKCGVSMDKDVFTIGFARRATGYKRADMLLSDFKRLVKIAEKFKGIQIIYSGKAHPNDVEGKEIIKRIFEKIAVLKDKVNVCYVEDYNMDVARMLVSGVDVWLNTPLRPKEASGTSGMKAAHNGVVHFSVLDGWWLEGHIENVTGWSIGIHPSESAENDHGEDLNDLYSKLEYVILPMFYGARDKWIDIMRHTIAINASFFNSHRMLEQYVLNSYFL